MTYPFRLFLACFLSLFFYQLADAASVHTEMITKQSDKIHIEIHYPVIGNETIDADISGWAKELARNFEDTFAEEPVTEAMPYELKASCAITRPSDRAISLVWDVASYTGGAHGNLDIVTQTYDLQKNILLDIHDFFGNLDVALNRMSAQAYRTLSESLGEMRVEDMLASGTAAEADNFSSLALIPAGIRVYFQPYQVAPWAAGSQSVDIRLEELVDAAPLLELWGRSS